MKKVICIGSATKDIFLEVKDVALVRGKNVTVQELLAFELGSKIYVENYRETLGGSAVNVAATLAKSGIRPFVFARVSRGETGKWITKKIGSLRIKKNYIQQKGGVESAVSVIISNKKSGDHFILRTGDSVENFDWSKAFTKFREKVDWVYVGSQKAGWQDKMSRLFSFAQKKKAKIALNPSSWQISKSPKTFVKIFNKVEILFLNRSEAVKLVKNVEGRVRNNPRHIIEKLISYGVKIVAMTDGANGAYIGSDSRIYFLPAKRGKIVETTGAGDAFCGAFLASYVENEDIKKALSWGVLNGWSAVRSVGGTSSLLSKKELKYAGKKIEGEISFIK